MKLTLGAFIARLRKEKGLTQRELAEMLSVSDKTVSHWEREESSPDILLLPLIAEIFEITVDELLKGERKEAADTEKAESEEAYSPLIYGIEVAFNKFRTKNFIPLALTVIAFLCGLIVNYYKTISLAYLVFLALWVVPLLLTAVFRGSFSSVLSSPYIDRETLDTFRLRANRITTNSFYFSFLFFLISSVSFISFSVPEITLLLILFVSGTGLVLLCETLLRNRGIIKSAGKPLQIRKITALKIICIFLCFCVLCAVYLSHMNINLETSLYNNSEYTVFENIEDFIEYIEKDVSAPEEIFTFDPVYTPADKGTEYTYYTEFGLDSTVIQPLSPDYDGSITFTYNNLEVAHIRWQENSVHVYSHADLLAAEKIAEKEVSTLVTLHFAAYAVTLILTFILYSVFKKKILSSQKNDKITLIKRF